MSLELEEEWAKQKAAKQDAGRALDEKPRKSRKGLIVALVGILLAGAMVAIVIWAGDQESGSSGTVDNIRIEMRAMPPAEIRVDGKKVGTTPMSLQFPRSTREIEVEATMIRHWVKKGAQRDDKYVDRRRVTLDKDQLIDFKTTKQNLVESASTEDKP
jgi:hypothetical protein